MEPKQISFVHTSLCTVVNYGDTDMSHSFLAFERCVSFLAINIL